MGETIRSNGESDGRDNADQMKAGSVWWAEIMTRVSQNSGYLFGGPSIGSIKF